SSSYRKGGGIVTEQVKSSTTFSIDAFSVYYYNNVEMFEELARSLSHIYRAIYPEEAGHYFECRVKEHASCVSKIERKYTNRLADGANLVDLMTDLVGTRIVCLFSDEIEPIVETLRKSFDLRPEY